MDKHVAMPQSSTTSNSNVPEPFPTLSVVGSEFEAAVDNGSQRRASTASARTRRRSRASSLMQSFVESNPPLGMWQATGEVGSKIPTLPEIRSGAFAAEGWSHEGQMERRGTNPHEIHRRRTARTMSVSTRARKGSILAGLAGATPVIAEERHEYFPGQGAVLASVKEPLVEERARREGDLQQGRAEQERKQSMAQDEYFDAIGTNEKSSSMSSQDQGSQVEAVRTDTSGPDETGTYPNGYRFPKKHTWTQATAIGLTAFWKFFLTPFGFVVTIYGLNIIGWGAMIFFVLLKAAPAMCHPSCDDDSSARKKWIEIDSQILNALFCVTGFGLIPWRFRDFYYLMRWRLFGQHAYHRRLAGIYRGWYRLPGSDQLPEDVGPPPLAYNEKNAQTAESPPSDTAEEIARLEENPAIPIPVTSMPEPPLTGVRAPPTKSWTIDIVVWMYILNTAFQACLAGFMWALNRFNRPSWATGLFITTGCLVAIIAGIVVFIEGSKVKKIEGIPVQEYDILESVEEYQERKAQEDKKTMKKEKKTMDEPQYQKEKGREHTVHTHRLVRSEKLKGHHWFTRH